MTHRSDTPGTKRDGCTLVFFIVALKRTLQELEYLHGTLSSCFTLCCFGCSIYFMFVSGCKKAKKLASNVWSACILRPNLNKRMLPIRDCTAFRSRFGDIEEIHNLNNDLPSFSRKVKDRETLFDEDCEYEYSYLSPLAPNCSHTHDRWLPTLPSHEHGGKHHRCVQPHRPTVCTAVRKATSLFFLQMFFLKTQVKPELCSLCSHFARLSTNTVRGNC